MLIILKITEKSTSNNAPEVKGEGKKIQRNGTRGSAGYAFSPRDGSRCRFVCLFSGIDYSRVSTSLSW